MHRTTANHVLASAFTVVLACSLETGGTRVDSSDEGDQGSSDQGTGTDQGTGDEGTGDQGSDDRDAGTIVTKDGAVIGKPVTTGQCTAGHYEGMYTCTSKQTSPFGIPSSSTVMGNLTFDLDPSSSGDDNDEFDLINGVFDANASDFTQMLSGKIKATLKCGQPFQGELDGTYSSLLTLGTPMFEATLLATYDTKQKSFVQGTWSIPASSSVPGCDGTWTANYIQR